ncbi:hypothetical protein EBR44_02790 [bacterium]|nr:hypothetical protein [bacterium]
MSDVIYRIAVVGAGQLGSRHLQGLSKLTLPCEIDIVDPSAASLETAKGRYAEMPASVGVRAVRYHQSIAELPTALDLVIIATSADIRLTVLEAILQRASVRLMLIEKVLFQRPEAYERAEQLLRERGVRAWVNCPRREYPVYQELLSHFAAFPPTYAQVYGGDWGLGCNGVHFLDLFAMCFGAAAVTIDTAALDTTLPMSRRAGFREFTGTLRASTAAGGRMELTSLAGSTMRLLITFRSERATCIVDESAGKVFLAVDGAEGGWSERSFRAPFLSELVAPVVTRMLEHGESHLPTFAESTAYHLPFVRTLAQYAVACDPSLPSGIAPIT